MTTKPTGKRAATPSRKAPAKKAKPVRTPPALSKAKAAEEPQRRKRTRLDWEAIERDYRPGKFTLRELAAKFNTDAATIARRIAADRKTDPARWQKDLTDVVRQATNAALMAKMVEAEINSGQREVNNAVLVAADIGARIKMGQQQRVTKATEVTMRMLEELDATTTSASEIRELFDKVTEDLSGPGLAAAQARFADFMRLHNRIASVHKLVDAMTKIQGQEAKAYGLDDGAAGVAGDSFEDRVADLEGELPP